MIGDGCYTANPYEEIQEYPQERNGSEVHCPEAWNLLNGPMRALLGACVFPRDAICSTFNHIWILKLIYIWA